MNNEEKILEMLEGIQKDVATLKDDVAILKDDVAELKESHEETRAGVNRLIEWADECGYVIKFPLPKI